MSANAKIARTRLREAAVTLDRARGDVPRQDASGTLKNLPDLGSARWSLVVQFECEGTRYLLARKNDPVVSGPEMLSPRERLVLSRAALGHANKVIAFDLGVAVSTIGVLMSRAFRKLGVRSRQEAISVFLVSNAT